MAVTKTLSYQSINSAVKNNIFLIGESKVQETEKKLKKIKPKERKKIKLHLIGRLQSNKIKKAIKIYDVIETVASLKTLYLIQKEAEKIKEKQKIYFQINIGKDPKKNGIKPKELFEMIATTSKLKNIKLEGLMTILPQNSTTKNQERLYKKMKSLLEKVKKREKKCKNLSMGMSEDYNIASKEGATHVRIGTLLYGKR